MLEVANFLGVELNETFRIDGEGGCYTLTENGLFDSCGNEDTRMLARLFINDAVIAKQPWKPKYGEKYFYINKSRNDTDYSVEMLPWWGESVDYALYLTGNLFKTKEEALKRVDAYKQFVKLATPNMSWREDDITYSDTVNIAND